MRIWSATGLAVPPAVFRPARSRVPGATGSSTASALARGSARVSGTCPIRPPARSRGVPRELRHGAALPARPFRSGFDDPSENAGRRPGRPRPAGPAPGQSSTQGALFRARLFWNRAAVRTSMRPAAVAVTFPGAPCCSGVPALFALLCPLRRTIAAAARWGVANAFPFFAGGVRPLSPVEIRCGTRAAPFFRRARETRCLRTRMRFFPLTAFPTPL